MDPLNNFFKVLPKDELSKIPPNIYHVKKGSSRDLKMVRNDIYRTKQYLCEPFYKPVSLIIDMEALKLKSK